jgi:hypothetical protein
VVAVVREKHLALALAVLVAVVPEVAVVERLLQQTLVAAVVAVARTAVMLVVLVAVV